MGGFGRTCFTGSMWSASNFHRCVRGRRIFPIWWLTFCRFTKHGIICRPSPFLQLRCSCSPSIRGPGNIRELENLIERYVILGSEDAISSELLNWEHTHATPEIPLDGQIHLKKVTRQAVHDLERKIILSVLEANRWNRKRTASALKISYRALLYKIRRAGLPRKRGMSHPAAEVIDPTEPDE